jgi:hypothetical protein
MLQWALLEGEREREFKVTFEFDSCGLSPLSPRQPKYSKCSQQFTISYSPSSMGIWIHNILQAFNWPWLMEKFQGRKLTKLCSENIFSNNTKTHKTSSCLTLLKFPILNRYKFWFFCHSDRFSLVLQRSERERVGGRLCLLATTFVPREEMGLSLALSLSVYIGMMGLW